MKKLTILASALLFAGAAYAQAPTNTYQGIATRPVNTPANTNSTNSEVTGASQGTYSMNYQDYSQDSYINQAGSGNNATVDQTDGRSSKANGGSTAILNQTGDNNSAFQTQTLTTTPYSNGSGDGRNFMKATQDGSSSQSNQTQSGGGYNKLVVLQGANTTGNRAIQTQSIDATGGDGNQGTIEQTNYAGSSNPGVADRGSYNRAEQDQAGYNNKALIQQESFRSFAKQTQRGGTPNVPDGNSANIHQGDPNGSNTAIQDQSGVRNTARIQQGVSPGPANGNFARQTQSNEDNQADINQKSSNNYAEQVQTGMHNYSSILQENVASAAYTTQSGNNNTATVHQH